MQLPVLKLQARHLMLQASYPFPVESERLHLPRDLPGDACIYKIAEEQLQSGLNQVLQRSMLVGDPERAQAKGARYRNLLAVGPALPAMDQKGLPKSRFVEAIKQNLQILRGVLHSMEAIGG